MEAVSVGPKKKERCSKSVETASLESVSCSYSRWLKVTRGGSLAKRSSLLHTGWNGGSFMAPRAIPATVSVK